MSYPGEDGVVFRVGMHLLVVVGIFAACFIGLGIAVIGTRGDWEILGIAVPAFTLLFVLLRVLRLEIHENGFSYRNLSTNRSVLFADVAKAYFETVNVAPPGVATFWIGMRDGTCFKINLRTFPLRAAATLFDALERNRIPIDAPDTWAARNMDRQIRKAQADLEKKVDQPNLKPNPPGAAGRE